MYQCGKCGVKFRVQAEECPGCGSEAISVIPDDTADSVCFRRLINVTRY